jgi:midasin
VTGDTQQEILQHFDDILENPEYEDLPTPQIMDISEITQLEYVQSEDDAKGLQALGPASADEAARLNELTVAKTDMEDVGDQGTEPVVINEPIAPEVDSQLLRVSPLMPETAVENPQSRAEYALTRQQVGSQRSGSMHDAVRENDQPKLESDIEDPVNEENIEIELRRWQANGRPSHGAEELWRLYETLTHDLSYAFCEQLRLILEPTMATRLKGDYRTGKRLNMKKIIPYIASEYTKDKIWLRRTRPSQREYQVLIALDDSRSMSESHSVHLAYQTLALVSKALTLLEVGDVGVVKFGESVDLLHGFDGVPFNDQVGSTVMGSFSFSQRATNVLSLVETSLKLLEEARERRVTGSSTAADLWQLEIIISDGICQDHDKLKAMLRKAEEQRIMVVFIVIDSLYSNVSGHTGVSLESNETTHNSILSMSQVAYKNIDGKMELQMQRYLDSFPFEYYVVLRNVEALPEVLVATLKQFFERIADD